MDFVDLMGAYIYATLFAVHQYSSKKYMKKREIEKNNQKTNISKKHSNYTRNTDASCDETITKKLSFIHCYRLLKKLTTNLLNYFRYRTAAWQVIRSAKIS